MAIQIKRRVQLQGLPGHRQNLKMGAGLEQLGDTIKRAGGQIQRGAEGVAAHQAKVASRARSEAALAIEDNFTRWQAQLADQKGVDENGELKAKNWVKSYEGKFEGDLGRGIHGIYGLDDVDEAELKAKTLIRWRQAVDRHVVAEDENAFRSQTNSVMALSDDQGRRLGEDPGMLDGERRAELEHYRDTKRLAVQASAQRYGWDKARTELEKLEALSSYHAGAVESMAAADRPGQGRKWLEDHSDEIKPEVKQKLMKSLKSADARDFALRESLSLIDEFTKPPEQEAPAELPTGKGEPVKPAALDELDLEDLSPARREKVEGDHRRAMQQYERDLAANPSTAELPLELALNAQAELERDPYDVPLEEMRSRVEEKFLAGDYTAEEHDAILSRLNKHKAQKDTERKANDDPKLDIIKETMLDGEKLDRSAPSFTDLSIKGQNTAREWEAARLLKLKNPKKQGAIDQYSVDMFLSLPVEQQVKMDVHTFYSRSTPSTRARIARYQRSIINDTGAGRSDANARANAIADGKGLDRRKEKEKLERDRLVGEVMAAFEEYKQKNNGADPSQEKMAEILSAAQRKVWVEGGYWGLFGPELVEYYNRKQREIISDPDKPDETFLAPAPVAVGNQTPKVKGFDRKQAIEALKTMGKPVTEENLRLLRESVSKK